MKIITSPNIPEVVEQVQNGTYSSPQDHFLKKGSKEG